MNINLSNLELDNIGQWPYAIKLTVCIAIAVIIIVLGYWFFISPNFDQLNTLSAEEQTLRTEFEDKQKKASTLAAYENQLKEIKEKFSNILKRLPAENEMPGLLEAISKTGISAGLTFELFAPQNEIIHDFYIELPIKIKVAGDYNQLAIFLSRVAELNRIVTLHDFIISWSLPEAESKAGAVNKLKMEITAKIYWYHAK